MATRPVETQYCAFSRSINSYYLKEINEYARSGHLYYVKADYADTASCTLYGFKILKETQCFYFIQGRRITKDCMKSFALTPEKAFQKSLDRAVRYLNILCQRGRNVSHYLSCMDPTHGDGFQELKLFEELAKRHGGGDTIPPDAFNRTMLNRSPLYGEEW